MNQWTPEKVESASGARLLAASDRSSGPKIVTIDSRGPTTDDGLSTSGSESAR